MRASIGHRGDWFPLLGSVRQHERVAIGCFQRRIPIARVLRITCERFDISFLSPEEIKPVVKDDTSPVRTSARDGGFFAPPILQRLSLVHGNAPMIAGRGAAVRPRTRQGVQSSAPQLHCRGIARLRQRRQFAPRPRLRIQNGTICHARMTLRAELSGHEVDVSLVVASYTEMCVRHAGRHREAIPPLPFIEIEYVNEAQDVVEGVETAD